jgi:hypothetical protein
VKNVFDSFSIICAAITFHLTWNGFISLDVTSPRTLPLEGDEESDFEVRAWEIERQFIVYCT